MADADDDGNIRLVKRAVRDPQGNFQWRRILDAIRGRRSAHVDLGPWLLLGLLGVAVLAPAMHYLGSGTIAGSAETLGWFLLVYAYMTAMWVSTRLESYYEDDEELAVEELRARYARGEFDFEEFQRLVDRVYEEGPGFVFDADGGVDGSEGGGVANGDGTDGVVDGHGTDDEVAAVPGGEPPAATVGDPMEILQVRFARGELDEAEYRRRVAVLRETTDEGTGGDESDVAGGPDAELGERESTEAERDPGET